MSGVTVPTTMKPMSCGDEPGVLDRLDRRFPAEIRGGHAGIDDVALADAGPLQNPFVGRLHHLLEVGVGQHARRHVGGQRRNRRRPSADARGLAVGHHNRESLRSCGRVEPEVAVCPRRRDAPARRAIEEADLDQERLVDVLDRVLLLADRRGDRVQADRAAAELVDDRAQQLAVDLVEPVLVHLEQLEARVRDLERDRAVGAHLRVVADAAQQPVDDARRAARPLGDLGRGGRVDRHVQDPRRAADDFLEVRRRVELEAVDDAEARAQRRGQQPGARRRADQREALQRHLHRPRARPLADDDVDLVVLERRVEDLLDHRRHAVNLVDEEDLVRRRGW